MRLSLFCGAVLFLHVVSAFKTDQLGIENLRYLNHHLYEVACDHEKVLKLVELQATLHRDFMDIWSFPFSNQPGQILVSPVYDHEFKNFLKNENISFTLVDNWFSSLQEDFESNVQNKNKTKRKERYYSYSQIESLLGKYYKRRPRRVKLEIIGTTYEKRKIFMMKISTNSSKPIIWLDGGIHAREWITVSSAMFVIRKLLRPNAISNYLLARYQFYIVPLLNPDGYEYSRHHDRLWRKNRSPHLKCRGVDLNRNFGYRWGGKGSSDVDCSDIFRGYYPVSEYETRAVSEQLVMLKSKIKLYLSLHSFGQFIFVPFGYELFTHAQNHEEMMRVANISRYNLRNYFRTNYSCGNSAELMYAASGGSFDYAKGKLNITYTYTIELPDKGRFGFKMPARKIENIGNQVVQILIDMTNNMR